MTSKLLLLAIIASSCVFTVSFGKKYDPCCSYPCQHRGVCIATKNYEDYICDCAGTPLSYYGKNCEIPTFGQWIANKLRPSPGTVDYILTSFKPFWNLVELIHPLKRAILSTFVMFRLSTVDSPPLYATSGHEYTTLDAARNKTTFARALPPVPKNCPKPLGMFGKDKLPDVDEIVEKLFKRKEFLPDKLGLSVFVAFFAQHFTHQFFKTDFSKGASYTFGEQAVDASQIYGNDKGVEDALRSHVDGKMRMQTLNGEEYPPYLKDINMTSKLPKEFRPPPGVEIFALGHDFFSLLPGLFLYSTIFLREHNRVCELLKAEHPEWDDERLFQTAKLVVLGITIKIGTENYVQHMSNFHLQMEFDPTLLHDKPFNFANRVFVEHNHLYHWHQMMPDEFNIDGTIYPMKDFMFRSDLVVKHGTQKFAESLSKQLAGQVTLQNHGPSVMSIVKLIIEHGRELKLQPYNEYRKRFGPYKLDSIDQITGNKEHRRLLRELYGDDVNGIEFFVGMMAEERRYEGGFGPALYALMGPYSLKALFAAPICSPEYWKPSTFGGDNGFEIVKTASIQKLFCTNMPGDCGYVDFHVPGDNPESNAPKHKTEL